MTSPSPSSIDVHPGANGEWYSVDIKDEKLEETSSTVKGPTELRQQQHQPTTEGEEDEDQPRGLVSYHELPPWYQDNPHIRHGYRPVLQSARACLRSWTYLHNETLNIYTHLVPAVALLLGEGYLLAYLYEQHADRVAADDYAIVGLLLLAATTCLGLSAAYHTLMAHSHSVEALFLRFDLVGIVLLTLGSFISGIYVTFWCEVFERRVYWSMIGSLSFVSIVIMLAPHFQGQKWRTFRLLTLVCTGLAGVAPFIHGIKMFGFAQMARQSGLPYYLAEGGLFLLGAVVYATRFPECTSPGRFDIYGSSHQIFHVLVVLATIVHLVGVLNAFSYNYHHRQCS